MSQNHRQSLVQRSSVDWVVDGASLLVHFFVLPLLQVAIVYSLLDFLIPELRGKVSASVWTSIGFYLVIDYAWYWNHRLFHAETPLWNLHSTHHKPDRIDVLITARNALVSHIAMVYLWFIGLATYVLSDASGFLALVAFGTVVNFWGHTHLNFKSGSLIGSILGILIVTPLDHHWHHSRENSRCNFGTVFNVWDRLHGTLYRPGIAPKEYGDSSKSTVWSQLIWPFSR